ncbi:MAG TPA: exodeoxyribonuclease VII small subunit [Alkalispirochaeta sp.]|nr:exodeoxyribonuclease VII small subunit [Alkalispirochaeta sp.]
MSDFEQRLQRLEEIAEQLRDGSIQVDEAAQLFEEGVKLARTLDTELQRIERRVEILANQPVEEETPPSFELFPDLSAADRGESPEP